MFETCRLGTRISMTSSSEEYRFVEIIPPHVESSEESGQSYVEAYVTSVEPHRCGLVVKQVTNGLPSNKDLSHLKRVRRRLDQLQQQPALISASSSSALQMDELPSSGKGDAAANKRRKTCSGASSSPTLDILLGSCSALDHHFLSINDKRDNQEQQIAATPTAAATILAEKFNLQNVFRVKVPGRYADSRTEWEEFNAVWPTTFYPMRTLEHRANQLELTESDKKQMISGSCAAIGDVNENANDELPSHAGAVVVHSTNGQVLSRASDERKRQHNSHLRNPLETSIIFAIQGLSRVEREAAIGSGMDSPEFQKGQYLCTGCDLYTTKEPSVFEAMALVHARIRRVVFMTNFIGNDASTEQYVKGLTEQFVHNLPGTNHKFRAFACQHQPVETTTQKSRTPNSAHNT
ncbi:hypothetical protein ACA910_010765 [Epithemia clementina (nom. ined.)]